MMQNYNYNNLQLHSFKIDQCQGGSKMRSGTYEVSNVTEVPLLVKGRTGMGIQN